MAMRVSGINSGLDTDAIVSELVSAYSKKTEKYTKEQTKLSWKQEAFKSLNAKVYSLYTNVSKFRYSGAYNIKKTTSSDQTKATVSAGSNAVNGTQKLNVLQTAQSAYLTGNKVSALDGKAVKGDTTLSELGLSGKASLKVNLKDKEGNAISKEIELSGDSKVSEVVTKLQDAGLNASFDEKNGRFYLSSKASGSKGDFEIVANATQKVPKMENDQIVKDDKGNVVYEEIEEKPEVINASNRLLSALGLGGTEVKTGKEITSSTASDVTGKTKMLDLGYPAKTGEYEVHAKVNGKEITGKINMALSTSIDDVVKQMNQLGIDATFDEATRKISFFGMEELSFTSPAEDADGTVFPAMEDMLGIGTSDLTESKSPDPIRIAGQDAKILLNGVEYTSDTNNFAINGLNITANAVTDKEEDLMTDGVLDMAKIASSNAIAITTSTDTQGLYDTIKDFLTEYNNVINEITKLYNADSAKGYEPLTDEEKDAMSDTEIEKWETKIKDSLLRRDSSLDAVMSAMISSINQGIEIKGTNYSLGSFGIQTLGFLNAAENEHNALHINGDSEDENTSGYEDKLMKKITEDADNVVEFMKQLSTNLYEAMDKQMQSTSLRSRYKIYNDKEMDKQYNNYSSIIKQWEKKVSAKEDYYYKQFSAMETALSKINGQQSQLSGLLGM